MFNDADISRMKVALALAERAGDADEVPIGAVLVDENGEVLGEGFNSRERTHRTTAHAEILALEEYNEKFKTWRLPKGARLYVSAEPCLMCASAMLWARLDHLFYGCRDTKNAALERIKPWVFEGVFDHRFVNVEGGLLGEEGASLLSAYFKRKRKKG